MPVRAIFLLLLHLIDLLQWVKTNTNRCHRSLAGAVFHLPFFVLQQQQCYCNRNKGFVFLSVKVLCVCPSREGWIAGVAEHGKLVTIVEMTLCTTLSRAAHAICVEIPKQFGIDLLKVVGVQCLQFHIRPQDVWPYFPVLSLFQSTEVALSEPVGSKRRGRHACLPCTFASSALQVRLPEKMQVVTVAFGTWAPVPSKACG